MGRKGPVRPAGRLARTVRALLFLLAVGAVLTGWNLFSMRRDIALATGPPSARQLNFLEALAGRPDIDAFFRGLGPEGRLRLAANIGHHRRAELAPLAATLLSSFDADARAALASALAAIAERHPEAVAAELARGGSFQQQGLTEALDRAGPGVLQAVAAQFASPPARPAAAAYLVSRGEAALPVLRPLLQDEDPDVRLAAADALGKLRDRASLPRVLQAYQTADEGMRAGFLVALASMADARAVPALREAFLDASRPASERLQAAMGLGRAATPEAVDLLWAALDEAPEAERADLFAALQIAGDAALGRRPAVDADGVRLAGIIESPVADALLARALEVPDLRLEAARAAQGRPRLVQPLERTLPQVSPDAEGAEADAVVAALLSTASGRARLAQFRDGPFAGFVMRRERLER
jgi:hypothetical protein